MPCGTAASWTGGALAPGDGGVTGGGTAAGAGAAVAGGAGAAGGGAGTATGLGAADVVVVVVELDVGHVHVQVLDHVGQTQGVAVGLGVEPVFFEVEIGACADAPAETVVRATASTRAPAAARSRRATSTVEPPARCRPARRCAVVALLLRQAWVTPSR